MPVLAAREPILAAREPTLAAREPILAAREPTLAAREPVLAAREPTLAAAPRVTMRAGVHAEVFSDPVENKPQFEAGIDVNAAGKANVTFKACQRMQRSRVEAVVQSR